MSAPGSPPSSRTELESQLASYRDMVLPTMMGSIPDREPKRHLYDLIKGYLSREGKGIRPALCIATCRAFGGSAENAVPSATAIELLHNAFLVHDDVEDSSEYRRNSPTLHRQYGVPLAVNVGDAMNAMSVRVLRQNLPLLGPALTSRVLDEFDHMSLETIEGQAMELGWIRDNHCHTTEEDYLLMVLKKTCWYSFIHPCRIGALIAGADAESIDEFNRFGCYLGTAFQIQDDVLNLVGDQSKYGKETGGDILEGKRTLMLAHLFKSCAPLERERLRAFFGKPRPQRLAREAAWVRDLLRSYGSIDYGSKAAHDFAEAAGREFDAVFDRATPGADVNFLRSLLDYVVRREV
jgi:geranylgeranyl diphosphate synthase type II